MSGIFNPFQTGSWIGKEAEERIMLNEQTQRPTEQVVMFGDYGSEKKPNLKRIEFKCRGDQRLPGGWCENYEKLTLYGHNGKKLVVKIPKSFDKKK